MSRRLAVPLLALALAVGIGGSAAASQSTTPAGLVTISQAPDAATASVVTYDPTTGTRTGSYATPWKIYDSPDEFQISRDREWLAQPADGTIRLAHLTNGTYQTVHTWKSSDISLNGRLVDPQFTAQDKLMFAAVTGLPEVAKLYASYQVDPADPATAPVKQSTAAQNWDASGHPATWALRQPTDTYRIDGRDISVDLLHVSEQALAARFTSDDDRKFTPYRCDEQLDSTHLVCMADVDLAEARGYALPKGVVAIGDHSDPESGLRLNTLIDSLPAHAAPAAPEPFRGAYLSPDTRTVLMATANGWYRANTTGTPPAQYAFAHLGGGDVLNPLNTAILGWDQQRYTGN